MELKIANWTFEIGEIAELKIANGQSLAWIAELKNTKKRFWVENKELKIAKQHPQKQKERKDIVTKDIRSFFGGSTIVKLSRPLNSKEKKIIKIVWRKLNVYIFSFPIGFIA